LRGFEQHINDFHQRNVAVAVISVDSPEESLKLIHSKSFTMPFLSDPKAEVIRSYGVLHPKGGEDGRDIARPAEFFVDSNGIVQWVNLTDDIRVRARPDVTLKAIDGLVAGK